MSYTGHEVGAVTGGQVTCGGDRRCTGVSTDSRTLRPGDLFVPLVGERFDGHAFIEAALQSGACGCLIQPDRDAIGLDGSSDDKVVVIVPDTLRALGDLAADHLRKTGARVVAITGSNGKTTTKDMLTVMLAVHGQTHCNPGNFNNLVGLPLTAFDVRSNHDYAVFEMGMNRPGEIARLTEIARPKVGVITSVAAAHLEGLRSIEGVTWAKGELFLGLGEDCVAIVNTRDKNVLRASEGISARRITVGTRRDHDVCVEAVRRTGVAGLRAQITVRGRQYELRLRAMGRHNIWNAALACGVLVALDLELQPGLDALFTHTGLENRLSWKVSAAGVNVIDDTYNANPASVRAALQTLVEVAGDSRRIAVLGDMLELGEDAASYHREIGMLAADVGIDYLVAVGEHRDDLAEGYGEATVLVAHNAALVFDWLRDEVESGDWVLVKGSRGMRMERVVAALLGTEEATA